MDSNNQSANRTKQKRWSDEQKTKVNTSCAITLVTATDQTKNEITHQWIDSLNIEIELSFDDKIMWKSRKNKQTIFFGSRMPKIAGKR